MTRYLRRLRRRFLVWWYKPWRRRFMRCPVCGSVSAGQPVEFVANRVAIFRKQYGCGHPIVRRDPGRARLVRPPLRLPPSERTRWN